MSFSTDVKTELLTVRPKPCCERAFYSAMLLFGRDFSAERLSLLTENEGVAQAYVFAVRFFSGVTPETQHTDGGHFRIVVDDRATAEAVLAEAGFSYPNAVRRIPFSALSANCCKENFLRGAFTVCGTVTDPEKEYNLEFACPSGWLAEDLIALTENYDITLKQMQRGGAHVVYLKNSEQIEELLGRMGATENAMSVMGAKMYKDVRNTINRKVNFENANLSRSIAAATRQYEAIMHIAKTKGLDSLPAELKLLAQARIENREMGAAELSKLLPGDLTVSGVNHRFRRIMKIAENITEKSQP